MIHAIEASTRPAFSFASWPKMPQHVTAARSSVLPAVVDRPYQSRPVPPQPTANTLPPLLSPFSSGGEVDLPRIGLPPLPGSEAESVFAARSDEGDSPDTNVIVAEGVDYSGLDASWKVIPTAEFDKTAVEDRVERLV